MSYRLIINEEAVTDIQEAYDFYESLVPDLGLRYLQEPDEHIENIKNHPLHYSFWFSQEIFRSHSLKNFPFSIIYEVTDDEIIVLAVHDHRKDPRKAIKRM